MIRFAPLVALLFCSCSTPAKPQQHEMRVRITAYWRDSDKWTRKGKTANGSQAKHMVTAAVDPKIIPYGSKICLNTNPPLQLVAEDTGSAVKSRKASRKTGGQPVVDIYFNKKSQATSFIKNNPEIVIAQICK